MIETFLATLQPMLTLFLFIALGFLLYKINIIPADGSKVFAKLLTYAICPALSFSSMAQYFRVETLSSHLANVIFGGIGVCFSVSLALFLARFFVKDKKAYELGVYKYALAFGNCGYVGDPVILALFGLKGLAFYKLATLPNTIAIYTWGISVLVPRGEKKQSFVKSFFNAPTVGMLIGMVFGITGLGEWLYDTKSLNFLTTSLAELGGCMGPIAMLLAGITIARFDAKKMLTNKKIYIATSLRLVVLPALILSVLFGIITASNALFNVGVDTNLFMFLFFFVVATPLGMNTIVFPEAYGGDPSTGAGMTMISHTLCIITIPLMYALMTLLIGAAPVF